MSVNNVGGAGSVQMMNIEGLDLESSLMAVQTNRVNLLDQQLKDQMGAVQNRNNRINELNVNMTAMNKALANVSGTAAGDEVKGADMTAFLAGAPQVPDEERLTSTDNLVNKSDATSLDVENLRTTMKKTGYVGSAKFLDLPRSGNAATGIKLSQSQKDTVKSEAAAVSTYLKSNAMKADPEAAKCDTRAKAEAYIKGQQSQIDALGNTQQMDMLRLQSLSNKRNEAFEIMTNFMKKLADSRSGIISKMG
jgi:hypothetical protein